MGESMETEHKKNKRRFEVNTLTKKLKWSREEERHEITWIAHRLGWMLICQSFLINAAIISQSDSYPWWFGFISSIVLGILGVWMSIRSILSVKAAQAIINEGWIHKAQCIFDKANGELDDYRLHRVAHQPKANLNNDPFHAESVKLHLNVGWFFVFTWIAIFIIGFFRSFTSKFPDFPIFQFTPIGFIETPIGFIKIGIVTLVVLVLCFFINFTKCFTRSSSF